MRLAVGATITIVALSFLSVLVTGQEADAADEVRRINTNIAFAIANFRNSHRDSTLTLILTACWKSHFNIYVLTKYINNKAFKSVELIHNREMRNNRDSF